MVRMSLFSQLRNFYLLIFSFLITCTLTSHSSLSQNLSSLNWNLGTTDAGIKFGQSNQEPQLVTGNAALAGVGGGVTISDPVTGDLLFYSDGQNIYDRYHNLLPSVGAGLSGDVNINRAAVVMPMPYTDGRYYLFTNSGNGGVQEIQYTVIDKNLQGNALAGEPALGDVSLLNQPTGLTNPSEGMILIQQDIDNYWLVSQDVTSSELKVTAISSGVLGATTSYDLWDPLTAPAFEVSNFAFDPVNERLAVAPKAENRNVTLFDFDLGTGVLTLDTVILNSGSADGQGESVYGMAWSPSGDILYTSRFGSGATDGNVYQYDLNSTVQSINSVLPSPVFRSYGLQIGPDDNIYHLYQASNTSPIELGVITAADSVFNNTDPDLGPQYDLEPLGVSGIVAQQFPSVAAEHFQDFVLADFFVLDTCANRSTKLFSTVSPTPTSYEWNFGDGGESNAVNPVYTYETAGSYSISLTVSLNGISETVTKQVEIVEGDLTIDLGTDTVLCAGETLTLDAGAGGLSYAWNTDETTQTIVVDTTGVYSVNVISPAGCVYYDYIGITTYGDTTTFRNQWYFGEGAGIDFDNDSAPIEDANLIMSPQAASSVSDLNGELLSWKTWRKKGRFTVLPGVGKPTSWLPSSSSASGNTT